LVRPQKEDLDMSVIPIGRDVLPPLPGHFARDDLKRGTE
jgi:hypothetical protein